MFGLDNLMDMLFDSAMESLNRHERVIQLLKRLNLDPDHPPADFEAVYKYALVEYGVGKPRPVLEIFRQAKIQELFREALERNNPSILLKNGEDFLTDSPLQADLQASNVDVRREFYAFAAVFIEVAKRTRTPAEILAEQKLESLHRQIGGLQERLNRLPTIEGMRTEMARLAGQGYPALLGTVAGDEPFSAERCNAFALAQQIRGWFETLGYRFETHEVWEADYFEWIINVSVWRSRYIRILVRGVDGEVGLVDVNALRQSVETHKTDEGWIVTARRVARAARDQVAQPENSHLGCYTLDELLDQDADFSSYLTWLETEIQKRGIDQKYVPLACLKEEIDPDTQQRIGMSRYGDRDGWIDGYIDLWLDDPAKEHISVLGEFGTGKTWFTLHYAWKALQRYREAQRRGLERPRLPLVIPLRDYAKAVSVESLFSEFFFRKHEIPIPGYSAFEQLNRMGKLLLIFDGFDEMAARVDRQEMINNFWELAKVVVPGAKVILTCRTEHFPDAKEGRALLNAELQASTRDLTGETPQFEVLELEKFNEEQIRQVLEHQAQRATVEQIMGNPQLLDLARRPVLTELILEALPDIEAGKPVDMSRVYLYAVRHKMERDIKAERTFTSMADKLYFMCELSWEMLSSDRMSINYREFPDRIRKLFGVRVRTEKDLDHWHYDMMGQTLLIRNSHGDYSPAHRSLLEFFVAYKFSAELGAIHQDFLEPINSDNSRNSHSEYQYSWSEFFNLQQNDESEMLRTITEFNAEEKSILKNTLGLKKLDKATLELAKKMVHADRVWSVVMQNQLQDSQDSDYLGGNCISLLSAMNTDFKFKDLKNLNLKGAQLNCSNLEGVNFSGSDLSESEFINTSFENTTFLHSDLEGAQFSERQDVILAQTAESVDIVSIKNNWLYEVTRNSLSIRKICFLGDGNWTIHLLKDASFFLFLKGSGELKLWQNSKKSFATFDFGSPSIKKIAYDESRNVLSLLRGNNIIEIWNLNIGGGQPEKILSFCPHKFAYDIGYSEYTDELITYGKDADFELDIKIWKLTKGIPSNARSPKYKVPKSQKEFATVGKKNIYIIDKNPGGNLYIKIYNSKDGSFLDASNFEVDSDIWTLDSNNGILFYLKENSLLLRDCISSKLIFELPLEERAFAPKSIFVTETDEQSVFYFFLDYPETMEGICLDFRKTEILDRKTFSKNAREEANSFIWDTRDKTLTVGGHRGSIYCWNFYSSTLLESKKILTEYEGMSIQYAKNIDFHTLVWLKQRGVRGVPDIKWEGKIKACLILASAKKLSSQPRNIFLAVKSLIFERVKNKEFVEFVESLDDLVVSLEEETLMALDESGNTYFPEKQRFLVNLDEQVSSVNWEMYPELLRHFDRFLAEI